MYIDAFYDRERDTVLIAERVDGARVEHRAPPDHVFYYEHKAGAHRSIFGQTCAKYITTNGKKFHGELKRKRAEGARIFESDINPVFRVLARDYMGAETPKLHICFFDIEADFHPERGYAPTDDPFNAVTGITLYLSATQTLHSLVLCPPTLTPEQGQRIAADFPDTVLFTSESAMLDRFLDLIEDADVLSGWNCIPQTANVWLKDRIAPLRAVRVGQNTNRHGSVVGWHDSGKKRVNQIVLDNGMVIEASDEHRVPVMVKGKDSYTYPGPLSRSASDRTVAEVKMLMHQGVQDCYVEVAVRDNQEDDYTYRQFLTENLDYLFSNRDFDIAVESPALKKKVKRDLDTKGIFKITFPYSRLFSKHDDYPRAWATRNFPVITMDDVRDQLAAADTVCLIMTGNRPVRLTLDETISLDACHMLGLMFTDGTYYRKSRAFTLYSSNDDLMRKAHAFVMSEVPSVAGCGKTPRRGNDNCMSLDFRRGSAIGLLSHATYDADYNKKLNVPLLSRLSHKQFTAFFSGLVDGDGCVRPDNLQVANYDGNGGALQELLFWNGVYATRSDHLVVVQASSYNEDFIRSVDLWHSKRAALPLKRFTKTTNSANKLLRRFLLPGRAIVKIREIVETDLFVPMGDIETEQHYFDCGGVRVHNSEGYDVPYLVNRIRRDKSLGNEALKKLCLWGQTPREREVTKFGKAFKTYELLGRVHLDYLALYQKHNTQQQHSYRLDYIGEIEIGENKTIYEGTLDDLYKKDFRRFIEYNRQDVMILVKIDQKRRFIELSNQIAHADCVLLKTTMGTVSLVDQAITNAMHEMGYIVPDRKPRPDKLTPEPGDDEEEGRTPVAGAFVAVPKYGINYEIGCVDINSLYPSAIRALNMSPETIVGQARPEATMGLVEKRIAAGTPRAEAWEGLFETLEVKAMQERSDDLVTIDFEDGRTVQMTGAELNDYVFDPANNVCISANGTLFRTDRDGMIPTLLGNWYAERKALQKQAKEWLVKAAEATTPEDAAAAKERYVFFDQRQLAAKIRLNALYGALLNESCKFFDERLGQSTTLSGRSIVRHMNAKINDIVCGIYDYKGDAIVYADTDSCYFSAYQVLKDDPAYADFDWTRENVIAFYDAIADETNDTFPAFMQQAFNVAPHRGKLIAAGRELIASKGLFVKKKKYAVLMYDKEGERLDVNGKPGKLKAMGLDLKRADTPKFMQKFLQDLLMDLLGEATQDKMNGDIKAFRTAFKSRPAWEKGSPKKVSNLSAYRDKMGKAGRVSVTTASEGKKKALTVPGHVRASLNWNKLCEMNGDRHVQRISDGSRIIVCKLKKNALGMDSVAYPIDEPHIPAWFRELPFDVDAMEQVIINQKLMNLVGVLKWDLSDTYESDGDEFFSFGNPKPAMGHNQGPEWDEDDDEEE